MNKYTNDFMDNKGEVSPENVKSSLDGSMTENLNNNEGNDRPIAAFTRVEEEKKIPQGNPEVSQQTEFSISQNQTAIQNISPRHTTEEKKRKIFCELKMK